MSGYHFHEVQFYLHWWQICRDRHQNGLQLKLKKSCCLFNGEVFSHDKIIIWVYHWFANQDMIVVHAVDYSASSTEGSHYVEKENDSVINFLPNPPVSDQCGPCWGHDWSISFRIPTQPSFFTPPRERGLCNLTNALVFSNGFNVSVVEFDFKSNSTRDADFDCSPNSSLSGSHSDGTDVVDTYKPQLVNLTTTEHSFDSKKCTGSDRKSNMGQQHPLILCGRNEPNNNVRSLYCFQLSNLRCEVSSPPWAF